MEMKFTTNFNNVNTYQQSNNTRILDDFCIDSITSREFLKEFQHLDHQFSITGSSFNPDLGIQTNGYDDPFDPFSQHHSTSTTSITTKNHAYEYSNSFSSFVENGAINSSSLMQSFQGVRYLNENISMDYNNGYSDLSCLSVNNYQDVNPLVSYVVPDESSCFSTAGNGHFYKGNTSKKKNTNTTKREGRGRITNTTTKGQWYPEEDRLLIKLVEKHGLRKWSLIAQILKRRIGKQCRERWYNHLRPNIKKDGWTDEEDKILIEVHKKVGNKWAEIAKRLPRRTENSIKNHWNATKRRQLSKRSIRTKKTPNSSLLLQDYIKSLNLIDKKRNGANKRYTSRGRASEVMSTSSATLSLPPQELMEFSLPNNNDDDDDDADRLVSDSDFDEIPMFEFPLDNQIFEESGIDNMPIIPEDDGDDELLLWS